MVPTVMSMSFGTNCAKSPLPFSLHVSTGANEYSTVALPAAYPKARTVSSRLVAPWIRIHSMPLLPPTPLYPE